MLFILSLISAGLQRLNHVYTVSRVALSPLYGDCLTRQSRQQFVEEGQVS